MLRFHPLCLPLVLILMSSALISQDSREAMWPAPTSADWKKPCLITWQRSWEDALSVSKETKKPILVCVNMDGEIASEHYAGIRYRQPEIAALYEPYINVIASVYRHTPRDYDEEGHRIPCPRFGSVTCGEHIAIEPLLYEKFMDGQRIAPRHIMVELDGQETYDVFYAFDTDSVFKAVRDGIDQRTITPTPIVRGDRPILERVASRHIEDRIAVEQAYQNGDEELRKALLEAAKSNAQASPIDLLRLGVFGLDVDLAKRARNALSASESADATDLIAEALSTPIDSREREDLIGTLSRLGEKSPKAKSLAVVYRGLSSKSENLDVGKWSSALAAADYSAAAQNYAEEAERLAAQNQLLESQDPEERLDLAEAFLSQAFETMQKAPFENLSASEKEFMRLHFIDAREGAMEAEKLGSESWRPFGIMALASYYLKDTQEAEKRAAQAVERIPTGESSWNSMAVLELFARLRWDAIAEAAVNKEEWPPEWLTDVNAACAVLVQHPHGTDGQVTWHYDILNYLKANSQAYQALVQGLKRFPNSPGIHGRLRGQILREKGVDALEPAYERILAREDAAPELVAYAGYASLVTGDFKRRRGRQDQANAAYDRAISYYEKMAEQGPEMKASADHAIAMISGAKARMEFENGDDEKALEHLLASFERSPSSAGTLDDLNISPADTSRMLMARFKTVENQPMIDKLQAALDKIDPELLKLPTYEGQGPPRRGGRRGDRPGRGNRRGNRQGDRRGNERGDGEGGGQP